MVVQRTREIGYPHGPGIERRPGNAANRPLYSGNFALGCWLGLVLSAGALRVMRSELHGVVVYDVTTILLVVLTISAVALLVIPALRIANIDPARPLREE